MSDVYLKYIDSVYVQVQAGPGIIMELSDHFTYFAENYRWHPKYKARIWDGKIRLLNSLTGKIYAGLAQQIKKFCESRDYSFDFDQELCYDNVSEHELRSFIESLKIPSKFADRDYQFKSILKCIRSKRRTLLSPTSSGKSLMIYILSRWFNEKTLVIVPTIGLVRQMESDFRDYGYKGSIHTSIGGLSKDNNIDCDLVITTWQSLNNGRTKMPKAWYSQFKTVFGDEAHGYKATSLIQIMTSLVDCPYRFGTTGTLDNNTLNKATIEGLFGATYQAVTTKELMDQGYVSKLKIKCIVLKYSDDYRKLMRGKTYQEEVDFITSYEPRIKFVKNLALSLKGNKLVFFRLKDHGKLLYDSISLDNPHNVFYIDGGVKGEEREQIRHAIEDEENATIVASLGTSSTGISINKLHHMIAAAPSKSKIKVLQSIGRMLRLHNSKDHAILYDIVDDLSWKKSKNYTLNHFLERSKIYDKEQFSYEIYYCHLK